MAHPGPTDLHKRSEGSYLVTSRFQAIGASVTEERPSESGGGPRYLAIFSGLHVTWHITQVSNQLQMDEFPMAPIQMPNISKVSGS